MNPFKRYIISPIFGFLWVRYHLTARQVLRVWCFLTGGHRAYGDIAVCRKCDRYTDGREN